MSNAHYAVELCRLAKTTQNAKAGAVSPLVGGLVHLLILQAPAKFVLALNGIHLSANILPSICQLGKCVDNPVDMDAVLVHR